MITKVLTLPTSTNTTLAPKVPSCVSINGASNCFTLTALNKGLPITTFAPTFEFSAGAGEAAAQIGLHSRLWQKSNLSPRRVIFVDFRRMPPQETACQILPIPQVANGSQGALQFPNLQLQDPCFSLLQETASAGKNPQVGDAAFTTGGSAPLSSESSAGGTSSFSPLSPAKFASLVSTGDQSALLKYLSQFSAGSLSPEQEKSLELHLRTVLEEQTFLPLLRGILAALGTSRDVLQRVLFQELGLERCLDTPKTPSQPEATLETASTLMPWQMPLKELLAYYHAINEMKQFPEHSPYRAQDFQEVRFWLIILIFSLDQKVEHTANLVRMHRNGLRQLIQRATSQIHLQPDNPNSDHSNQGAELRSLAIQKLKDYEIAAKNRSESPAPVYRQKRQGLSANTTKLELLLDPGEPVRVGNTYHLKIRTALVAEMQTLETQGVTDAVMQTSIKYGIAALTLTGWLRKT